MVRGRLQKRRLARARSVNPIPSCGGADQPSANGHRWSTPLGRGRNAAFQRQSLFSYGTASRSLPIRQAGQGIETTPLFRRRWAFFWLAAVGLNVVTPIPMWRDEPSATRNRSSLNPSAASPKTMQDFLAPEDVTRVLEGRLGRLHARQRLGMERDHEAQIFGQGLTFSISRTSPAPRAPSRRCSGFRAPMGAAGRMRPKSRYGRTKLLRPGFLPPSMDLASFICRTCTPT